MESLVDAIESININDVEVEFTKELKGMKNKQLNTLKIKDYSKPQRRFINEERIRRKRQAVVNRAKSSTVDTLYTFPQYHEYIATEVEGVSFYPIVNNVKHIQEHHTSISGKFDCNNNQCKKKGWSSLCIATTIRMYSNNRYNAIVYNQHCQSCNALGILHVDIQCYIERVVYRLKKWLGYEVETIVYSGNSKGPHKSALCEGCKNGCCSKGLESF